MKRNKNGITLIALIITIIVMLILVGVTVNLSANGELFAKARTASADTEKHKILEELIQNANFNNEGKIKVEELIGKAENKYGEGNIKYDNSIGKLTITGNKGKYEYKVTDAEIKLWEEPIGLTELEIYILGENGEGRNIDDIIFVEGDPGYTEDETKFKDGNLIKGSDITFKSVTYDMNLQSIYIEYNNEIYKFKTNEFGYTVKGAGVKKINEKQGREGKTVKYANKDWIILYDNNETVEIISKDVLKDEYHLELVSDADEALEKYNNAINLLNEEAKNTVLNLLKVQSLEGTDLLRIRCVGSNPLNPNDENVNKFKNSKLEQWPNSNKGKFNNVAIDSDSNWEEDFEKMLKLDIVKNTSETDYWMASRCILVEDDSIELSVNYVDFETGMTLCSARILGIEEEKADFNKYENFFNGIRPVIKLNSSKLKAGTDTDYVIE